MRDGLPGHLVSRETKSRLDIYVAELRRWQRALNLVSARTLPDVWERHVADCLQLVDVERQAETWIDLGSGGGLPGLIIAAMDRTPHVTLVESDSRKCAFLRSTARLMGVRVQVIESRIEDVGTKDIELHADVVTARALAPLTTLIRYAQPFLSQGAIGLFPKGRAFAAELTDARESWTFTADVMASQTDREGRILRITGLTAKTEGPGTR